MYKGPIWLTRDSDQNGLEDIVSAWKSRPVRYRDADGYAFWLDANDSAEGRLARYWRQAAEKRFNVVPDDDLQCIRIG